MFRILELIERKKTKKQDTADVKKDLCAFVGLDDGQLSRLINGKRGLTDKKKILLAHFLKCRVDDLFDPEVKSELIQMRKEELEAA